MDAIAQHAAARPSRTALVDDRRAITWSELLDLRNRLGHSLMARGLRPGEHVAIYAENSLEFLIAGAAARAAGAIPVPVNHRLTADEAAYVLDDSDATVVLASGPFVPTVEAIRHRIGRVRTFVLIGESRRPWAEGFEDLVAAGQPEPLPIPEERFGGSMVYTAGTTGKPKGRAPARDGSRGHAAAAPGPRPGRRGPRAPGRGPALSLRARAASPSSPTCSAAPWW